MSEDKSPPSSSKTVTQLAVFIENRAGRLAEVCKVVADGGNNIVGFSIADEEGYGIFRLIVDDTDRVKERLRSAGFTVRTRKVISAEVPHKPGGLAAALEAFRAAKLNVAYMYAIAESLIAFSVDDIEAGVRALEAAGIRFRAPATHAPLNK